MFEERKEELARLMTLERGKVLQESRGDVQEAIDMAYYAAVEGRRLLGETTPSELPGNFCMTLQHPVGVFGLITPFNFPFAIPAWKVMPALISGNTLVLRYASSFSFAGNNSRKVRPSQGGHKSGIWRWKQRW